MTVSEIQALYQKYEKIQRCVGQSEFERRIRESNVGKHGVAKKVLEKIIAGLEKDVIVTDLGTFRYHFE